MAVYLVDVDGVNDFDLVNIEAELVADEFRRFLVAEVFHAAGRRELLVFFLGDVPDVGVGAPLLFAFEFCGGVRELRFELLDLFCRFCECLFSGEDRSAISE